MKKAVERRNVCRFDRNFRPSGERLTRIGDGGLGGKALGLASIRDLLESGLRAGAFPGITVHIPTLTVLATDVFDRFMQANRLYDVALSGMPDDRIAHAFQQADLPSPIVGDLKALIDQVHSPLAVRSSSLLEDAIDHPFAGVYATKMIPNNQPGADDRFRRLVEAIKFVYASTFFKGARSYVRAAKQEPESEKMAVILQEVVGLRHGDRYYPTISGVGRSHNSYPTGSARPDEGVVNLALGLGKTIVDGGVTWTYSPARPGAPPPYGSIRELLKYTQLEFWAVNMGRPPEYNPLAETEYLVTGSLADAEYDGTLKYAASTYVAPSDRLVLGIGPSGPRVINFAPLLTLGDYPFNDLVKELLRLCRSAIDAEVEIEFAVTFESATRRAWFGFLQVRPLVVSRHPVEIAAEEMSHESLLLASDCVMGNGIVDTIQDVVYVRPESFEAKMTPAIAFEVEKLNEKLVEENRRYLLIGFGRWGSSDPWLGIAVDWYQISNAKAIVEATLPNLNVDPSQGSHFFHNMTSFQVLYFFIHHERRPGIDWRWLAEREAEHESRHVRHLRLERPLLIKADGRSGRGGIWRRT